jgi:hypothetical protein
MRESENLGLEWASTTPGRPHAPTAPPASILQARRVQILTQQLVVLRVSVTVCVFITAGPMCYERRRSEACVD